MTYSATNALVKLFNLKIERVCLNLKNIDITNLKITGEMMKKTLLICLLGLWTVLGMAAETDRGSLSYSGNRGDQNMSLQTETMRTEYRWVQVPYQEQVCRIERGTRRECRQEPPRRQCRTVNKPVCRVVNGRRVCRDRPVRVCRNIPGRRVCRNVPYQRRVCRMETRYRQERRAYQVVDSRTYASLVFHFSTMGRASGIRTDVNATLDRSRLNIRTEDYSSPRRALIYSVLENRNQRGRDLHITKNYSVRVVDANELFTPINEVMSAGEISQGMVNFNTGLMTNTLDTRISLKVSNGSVLMDRSLAAGEYRLVNDANRTMVSLNLRALLGADYTGQELDLEFSVRVPSDLLLNRNQFSKFENRKAVRRIWR